jgi:hypothetical protein
MGQGVPSNRNKQRKTIMSKLQNSPVAQVRTKLENLTIFGRLAMATMILLGATLATGCSTLPSSFSSSGLIADSAQEPIASGSQPQYLVDMQMAYGGSKKFKGNVTAGTTVQSAIEASGAAKKFRGMDVVVLRKVEGDHKPLQMTCRYNPGKKRVRPETDYALQHGDRIVITPKSENQLMKMLGTFADAK